MGVCVSVLNFKGGVGKTTISAHVMRVLYHKHEKSVLLVDLDSQFNLTQCLRTRAQYDLLVEENQTVFSAMEPPTSKSLYDVVTKPTAPPEPDDICITLRKFNVGNARLDLLAGDYKLIKYSIIYDNQKLKTVRDRFLRFISSARRKYDLVVIDCNPSSSFITLCALEACEHVLVPVRPDRYSILGLELVSEFISQLASVPVKPSLSVLLNGVPRSGPATEVEKQLRAHPTFGSLVYVNALRSSKLLVADTGYTGFATDRPVPYRELLKTEIAVITDEIVEKVGL